MANDQDVKKEVEHNFIWANMNIFLWSKVLTFYSVSYFYSIVFMLETAWIKWVAEFIGSN